MDFLNTCSAHWDNDDARFRGPHSCHLEPGHLTNEHECACRATPVEVLVA